MRATHGGGISHVAGMEPAGSCFLGGEPFEYSSSLHGERERRRFAVAGWLFWLCVRLVRDTWARLDRGWGWG